MESVISKANLIFMHQRDTNAWRTFLIHHFTMQHTCLHTTLKLHVKNSAGIELEYGLWFKKKIIRYNVQPIEPMPWIYVE